MMTLHAKFVKSIDVLDDVRKLLDLVFTSDN